MSLPVRCTTCNRVIGKYEMLIESHISDGRSREYILQKVLHDKVPPSHWCCRIILLTYIDTTQRLLWYNDPTLAGAMSNLSLHGGDASSAASSSK